MKVLKFIGGVLALLMACQQLYAQNYLEFIENKGQWDNKILFKGSMVDGAVALQKNGYRVLLHDHNDLNTLGNFFHHINNTSSAPVKKSASAGSQESVIEGGGGNNGNNNNDGNITVHSHAYAMRFLNANENPVVIPEKPQNNLTNYFIGNDSAKWSSGCKTFQAVTYKDVYPNIDVRYYTSNGTLKYDIIVHPGGDVSRIAMYYDGLDNIRQKDGALTLKTSVQEIKELSPYSYQLLNDTRLEVPCHFNLKGNIVRFDIDGAYSKTATLVIDPALIFVTFTGSTADNWGYTATYDGQGNFYAGGIVFSQGNFPVSNGAFQTTYQGGSNTGEGGGFDMAIMKFDPTGANRVYATYLGGATGNEQPHSLVVDGNGNLIIAGRTTSTDYPTKGSLQQYGPLGGTWDIVLTKLNATGTALVGSMRIGGSGNDGVNIRPKYTAPTGTESINRNYGDDARSEVITDGANNIYFASCTQSTDFPTTAGAFQSVNGAKNAVDRIQDAVVLKISADMSAVLFSTLLGGKDDDAAFVLSINPVNNHLYVAGTTASTDFPGNKTGVIGPAYAGGICDGFVAEFLNDGTFVRDSYFGTSGADVIYGIQFDKFGFPYIMGTTTGSWTIQNATFNQVGGKQFISKLKTDLSGYIYSTTFGPNTVNPNISPTAFLVDRCENVYVSGWGGGIDGGDGYPNSNTNGLPVTSNAILGTTDGSDFYFFVLEKNATSQLYGSFFGQTEQQHSIGEHVDGGTSRFDKSGVIYQSICANCGEVKPRFPTTPGVWASANGSTGCNLAAVKLAFNLAGVGAGIQSSINGVVRDTSGCVPLTAIFTDTLAEGKQYIWNFNDGGTDVTTTTPSISHTFNTIGVFHVRLIAVDSSSCNVSDTSYLYMRVRNDQSVVQFTAAKLPPCASLAYQFTNTSVPPALKPFGVQSFKWDFGDGTTQTAGAGSVTHTYASPGTYDVKLYMIDTSYCNYPDSAVQQIRLSANVKAQFTTPASGCLPYTAVFTNTSLGGQQFKWDFGDGTTSTQTSPSHLYNNPGSYQVQLIAIDNNTCNGSDTSAFFTITVSPNPVSAYTYSPQPTVPNTAITFTNLASNASRYQWRFGDNDSLYTILHDTSVQHLYNSTGKFNACLVSYNSSGCSDTSCKTISVTVIPAVDVPNAFSPNGDGRNDMIYVRGYGIDKMTWNIYNRWGALVFVSTSKEDGWNGTYKGALQPQDVYHYTLQIEFSTGEKVIKKGDITLLR